MFSYKSLLLRDGRTDRQRGGARKQFAKRSEAACEWSGGKEGRRAGTVASARRARSDGRREEKEERPRQTDISLEYN